MTQAPIREARQEDIPNIVESLVAMLQAMEASGGYALAEIEDVRSHFQTRLNERFGKSNMLYLVAEIDEQVIAILEASHMHLSGIMAEQDLVHIHGIYVEEKARGQGIAKALMEEALAWGRKQNCAMARLNVLANNPAKHLYTKLGFVEFQYEMLLEL